MERFTVIVALIDNGSLAPAAHRNLRTLASALGERVGMAVEAVSWKHSDWIRPEALDGRRAWTLARFVRAQVGVGERQFVFVPFFISPQGAIGSALRNDLEKLQAEVGGFSFRFTDGLVDRGVLAPIAVAQIRAVLGAQLKHFLSPPAVLVIDHGGPSAQSAVLRDEVTSQIRTLLGGAASEVVAASMEGEYGPLLAEQLRVPQFRDRDVIVAPLFLAPGRHAGPGGDLARICAGHDRCFVAELVGTHPLALDALADALHSTLSQTHASLSV